MNTTDLTLLDTAIQWLIPISICLVAGLVLYIVSEVFNFPERLRARIAEIRNAGPNDNMTMWHKSPEFMKAQQQEELLDACRTIIHEHLLREHEDVVHLFAQAYRDDVVQKSQKARRR